MRGILFLSVLVCLFSGVPSLAQRVIESESTAAVEGETGVFRLAVEGQNRREATVARAELINTEGVVVASAARTIPSGGGKQTVEFRIPLGQILTTNPNNDLAWYRLRYRVGSSLGVISLSQMIRDLFELRIAAATNVTAGMTYRTRVRALNPFTDQPVSGVRIDTLLKLDLKDSEANELELRTTGETNAEGFAVVDFQIPVDA